MHTKKFDVLIIGAGPAGCAAAIELAKSSLSIGLLDKAVFPRDKICGDALSVDVLNQFEKLSPDLLRSFRDFNAKAACTGVRITAPNMQYVDIPFKYKNQQSSGFTCKRYLFDNLLVDHVRKLAKVSLIEDCEVNEVVITDDDVTANTGQGAISAKLVIGSDGAHSVVRREHLSSKIDKRHHSAGLRCYFENVSGLHEDGFIELYFFKDILPGYLWIFPLHNGQANVGLGMLSSVVGSKKINLTKVLQKLLLDHPFLKERFSNSKQLESVKGHGLPLGWKERKISGKRFLLTGDAASLIDPFSGEGIGNAIRSGRVAAQHTLGCFETNRFDAHHNSAYDAEIYRRLGKEFSVGNSMLRLCRYPWLFNTIISKANKNNVLHQVLIDALADPDKKKWLVQPSFYFNLFFRS